MVSAVFAIVVATKVFAGNVAQYFHIGDRGAATGYDFSLSFALLAVGHLVGLWVGLAMLLGAVIAWGWAVPHYTLLAAATGAAADLAQAAWSSKVRFIGAGTIGVAAIWTLAKLVKPVISGLLRRWLPRGRASPARAPPCRVPSRTCRSGSSA